jgi:sugar/nucleoside kinase (ribokinase family)
MIYKNVIGTGGIGTGILFKLESNQTLGRDESRLAFLTDYKDYCKQHIVLHYIAKLCDCKVIALGMVGNDIQGLRILAEMQETGIDVSLVEKTEAAKTMFAVCFQYPDNSGVNITTANSACNLVTDEYIKKCLSRKKLLDTETIVVALPEVPLNARIELMKQAKGKGAFVASALLSDESEAFANKDGYSFCNLLAVNRDEAKSIIKKDENNVEKLACACAEHIFNINSEIKLIVTCGSKGCYAFEAGIMKYIPIFDIDVLSTAGAGDAFLGGTLSGIAKGLDFFTAALLGNIISTFSVLSVHSIADSVTKESVVDFIIKNDYGKELINVL